ncbi:MAG: HEPN domain-containing protein [Alphaproteobacteria bacterium]|nr:HEPN domain-containing protein [Alphaproteobacteria bacterium]MCB9792226.1 HEPN domain-containing protein [Alphaproteobacteria bacterium]
MSAAERIAAFLQLASEEVAAARLLADTNPRQAAYFCQQSAEKIARAVLTDAGVLWGTGHNLGQMAAALPENNAWRERIRSLDKHSPAATRFRYPNPAGRLTRPPELRRLLADVAELESLLQDVRAALIKDP